jgi:hypothetical protein
VAVPDKSSVFGKIGEEDEFGTQRDIENGKCEGKSNWPGAYDGKSPLQNIKPSLVSRKTRERTGATRATRASKFLDRADNKQDPDEIARTEIENDRSLTAP